MEMLYFTAAAVLLYLVSDRILNWIELRRGERFENRTLIFFMIILVLSLVLFNLIQQLYQTGQPAAPGAGNTAPEETDTPQR